LEEKRQRQKPVVIQGFLMKIGVIADTHLKQPSQELKDLLIGPFRDVEMILHAGDITELPVLEAFGNKTVLAVWGNNDYSSVRRQLPKKQVIEAGKLKIGLIHGYGGPEWVEYNVLREFEDVDCIVYGHRHTSSQVHRNGILLFNPGAFWAGNWGARKKTVGLLTVDDQISGEILYY
jgi:putative phosphoesterase